jgi:Dullard-like phosphatase family protein
VNKINDTTPNRKYYKYNNYTINSGPNIFKKGINLKNNYFYSQNYFNTVIKNIIKKNEIINIEDLLLLEENFIDIIYAIDNKSNIANECFELINFYSQSSLYNKFEIYFKDYLTKKIVHSAVLLIIFDLILIYHISFDDLFVNEFNDYLTNIIIMNHQSYLLICDYISNKISSSEKENIWVKKLRQMLINNINHLNANTNNDFKFFITKKNLINSNLKIPLIEVHYYIYAIQKCLTVLLKNLSEEDDLKSILIDIYNNIFERSSEELYNFFKKKIFRIINKNGSIGGSDISLYEANHIEVKEPFLEFKSNKKFSLVLDLDETLICFKIDPEKEKGLLRLRPGIYSFLLNLKKFYELIIFTSATPEYADPLLDAIEKEQKIFDYKLYRQHTIIYNNEIVKDISKIGRPLDKTIIVDNLQQNFRLQKENGIMIKPFWGEDTEDTALIDLCEILNKIAMEFDDVRSGIIKYKDDILSKVSSSVSRNKFQNYKY